MLAQSLNWKVAEALEPFAYQADIIDGQEKNAVPFEWFRFHGSITAITLGDCRRAKEAIDELRKAIR